jgi:hypothetical protein
VATAGRSDNQWIVQTTIGRKSAGAYRPVGTFAFSSANQFCRIAKPQLGAPANSDHIQDHIQPLTFRNRGIECPHLMRVSHALRV